MSDPLAKIHALDPRDLLSRLARMAAHGEDTPDVTLLLHTGAQVTGRVMSMAESSATFLVAERSQGASAAYIPATAVVAVLVQHARSYAHVLSFGELDAPPPSAPTRLGLRREIAEKVTALAATLGSTLGHEVDVDKFPDKPENLWSVSLAVRDLTDAITQVAAQPDGLEEIRKQVQRIVVKQADHPNLTLAGGSLIFEITSAGGPRGRLSVEALVDRLEKLL